MTDTKPLTERLRTDAIFDNTTLGNEAADAIEALQAKLDDAIQSSAHWQHQFTEAQAENERLDKENTDSLVSLATAIQHRDGFRKQLDYHRHEMDDLEEDYSNLQAERDALQAKLGDAIEQLELFAILVRNAALEEAAKVCFAMPAPTHCNRAEANLCDVMTAQCENEIRNLKEPTP